MLLLMQQQSICLRAVIDGTGSRSGVLLNECCQQRQDTGLQGQCGRAGSRGGACSSVLLNECCHSSGRVLAYKLFFKAATSIDLQAMIERAAPCRGARINALANPPAALLQQGVRPKRWFTV